MGIKRIRAPRGRFVIELEANRIAERYWETMAAAIGAAASPGV